jgi:hypothetical protein
MLVLRFLIEAHFGRRSAFPSDMLGDVTPEQFVEVFRLVVVEQPAEGTPTRSVDLRVGRAAITTEYRA